MVLVIAKQDAFVDTQRYCTDYSTNKPPLLMMCPLHYKRFSPAGNVVMKMCVPGTPHFVAGKRAVKRTY